MQQPTKSHSLWHHFTEKQKSRELPTKQPDTGIICPRNVLQSLKSYDHRELGFLRLHSHHLASVLNIAHSRHLWGGNFLSTYGKVCLHDLKQPTFLIRTHNLEEQAD